MKKIATVYTDMKEKFGLPRQSGIVGELKGRIVFEPEYRRTEAVRGLENFSHIWLIWRFCGFESETFTPTVRPPKLGGNKRVGVFATRSPNRPNPIGLSAVKLERIDTECDNAPVLYVSGVDMTDGTEILDIKPYLPFADCVKEATGALTERTDKLEVIFNYPVNMTDEEKSAVIRLIAEDPRPGYIDEPDRIYGMKNKDYNIKFTVENGIASVFDVTKNEE